MHPIRTNSRTLTFFWQLICNILVFFGFSYGIYIAALSIAPRNHAVSMQLMLGGVAFSLLVSRIAKSVRKLVQSNVVRSEYEDLYEGLLVSLICASLGFIAALHFGPESPYAFGALFMSSLVMLFAFVFARATNQQSLVILALGIFISFMVMRWMSNIAVNTHPELLDVVKFVNIQIVFVMTVFITIVALAITFKKLESIFDVGKSEDLV